MIIYPDESKAIRQGFKAFNFGGTQIWPSALDNTGLLYLSSSAHFMRSFVATHSIFSTGGLVMFVVLVVFFPYVPGSFEGPGACESITIKSVCSLISWPLGRNTCCYSGAISNLFISYIFLHWFAYDHFFCLALPTRDLGHLIPSGNLTWRWTFSTVHLIMLENHL